MATASVVGKQTPNQSANREVELSLPMIEVQSIQRLISAITGASIQSLTEMGDSDYSIGVAMFERWERAQSELESRNGSSEVLATSRELKQDLEQVFICGRSELDGAERSGLYKRTKNLLGKLDACLESLL